MLSQGGGALAIVGHYKARLVGKAAEGRRDHCFTLLKEQQKPSVYCVAPCYEFRGCPPPDAASRRTPVARDARLCDRAS